MTPTSQDSCGSTHFSKATLAPSEQSSGASSPPVEFTLEAEMKTIIGCATYPGDHRRMPRAASDAKGCTKGALVGGTAAISRLL
jgi:hypothetical protein